MRMRAGSARQPRQGRLGDEAQVPGRSLEARSDARPRGMAVTPYPVKGAAIQNPAYRPTGVQTFLRQTEVNFVDFSGLFFVRSKDEQNIEKILTRIALCCADSLGLKLMIQSNDA